MVENLVQKLDDTREIAVVNKARIEFFEQKIIDANNKAYEEMNKKIGDLSTTVTSLTKELHELKLEQGKRQAVQDSWLKYGYPIITGASGFAFAMLGTVISNSLFNTGLILLL